MAKVRSTGTFFGFAQAPIGLHDAGPATFATRGTRNLILNSFVPAFTSRLATILDLAHHMISRVCQGPVKTAPLDGIPVAIEHSHMLHSPILPICSLGEMLSSVCEKCWPNSIEWPPHGLVNRFPRAPQGYDDFGGNVYSVESLLFFFSTIFLCAVCRATAKVYQVSSPHPSGMV